MLQQIIREDGYWEYYVYDEFGRATNIFSAFGTQGVTTNSSLCRTIAYSYDTNLVGSGDAGVFGSASPRRTIEYLLNARS